MKQVRKAEEFHEILICSCSGCKMKDIKTALEEQGITVKKFVSSGELIRHPEEHKISEGMERKVKRIFGKGKWPLGILCNGEEEDVQELVKEMINQPKEDDLEEEIYIPVIPEAEETEEIDTEYELKKFEETGEILEKRVEKKGMEGLDIFELTDLYHYKIYRKKEEEAEEVQKEIDRRFEESEGTDIEV